MLRSQVREVAVAAIALVVAGSHAGGIQEPGPPSCAAPAQPAAGDADLYCIDLMPAAGVESGGGTAWLLPPPTPFGIAVTAAGEPLHDLALSLANLPDP